MKRPCSAATRAELERMFYLDDADLKMIARRRGDHMRGLQLVTVRYLGTFLTDPLDAPPLVVEHLAGQLGIADPSCVKRYAERSHTPLATEESYRRGIKGMRNLQEGRHALAARTFHGKKGELYQRYHGGMEDQLSALGLVLNAVTLWNTRYSDAAIVQLRAQGYPVDDADAARLSPLLDKHVNVLGRYTFTQQQAAGLRPLRDPSAAEPDDE